MYTKTNGSQTAPSIREASRSRRGSRKAGAALLTVIVGLFLITGLTVAVLTVTTNSLHTTNIIQSEATALNNAESGAERAVLWIRGQATPPAGTTPTTFTATDVGTPSQGTYTVTMYPDANNPTQFLKIYTFKSVGRSGARTKTVQLVIRQASFGRFAYFTDRETSSGGGAIWWNSNDLIDGPVHSNNTGGSNFNIDYSGWSTNNPRRPIFLDQVTASGSTINYNPSRPRTETDFNKVFLNGSNGYALGVPVVALPSSTASQKEAAWGGTVGFPSTTGVYLRAGSNGGIYVQGDSSITMSVDGSGNQLMSVKQGSNTTVIKFDKAARSTSVTSGPVGNGSPTSAAGLSNGVIYCSGSITALSGTIADNVVAGGAITQATAFTIATDVNSSKDITISGDLVYHTKPDKTRPANDPVNLAAGTLGLVGQDITIADDGTSQHNHPNRQIDAVMMAGSATVNGSISVQNYSEGSTGTLTVLGGLVQSTRGAVGTISNGVINHGYAKSYHYDSRLANTPPPFYPTTGQYDRMSWRVLSDKN